MGAGVAEGMNGGGVLRVVSDEKKDLIRMDPTCRDECVEKIGNCV